MSQNNVLKSVLISCVFFINARGQNTNVDYKHFSIYAGVGLTNAIENNTVQSWPGFYSMPFKFESKPSFELGLTYSMPLYISRLTYKPELGISTGRYIESVRVNSNTQTDLLDNYFEAITLKSIVEYNLQLPSNEEAIKFGLGPTFNFTSSDSKTEEFWDSRNIWTLQYSNKFFLGASAYVGISKNKSTIKLSYNYLKLSSQYRDIPHAPFYTLGITYEHKIF